MADSDIRPSAFSSFKIVSFSEDKAASIDYTKPAQQWVRLGGPIQHWRFRKAGEEIYQLGIGNYGETGVESGKVVVTGKDGQEWKITYAEWQDAYTITLANNPILGWTVPDPLSGRHEIEVKPVIVKTSDPPQYIPAQLFKLVSDD